MLSCKQVQLSEVSCGAHDAMKKHIIYNGFY